MEASLAATLAPLVRSGLETSTGVRSEEEEAVWIRRAQGGDPEAFRRLVDRHRDAVVETARRIVRSREEAEEVAQDAFVRAWRALPGFREEARFSTWLYRIVTRRAIDVANTLRRRPERMIAGDPGALENLAAPARRGLPPTDLTRLERILAELPPVRRAIVTLFYLRDQSIEEIAGIVDLPPGTVKSHLYRSRSILRRSWLRHTRREGPRGL
jgi:RNA polymerase sigma-70 factor (ECF subfamily)